MDNVGEVQERVETFILDNLLLGDDERMPSAEDSLIRSGVIDSTGILELIEFLEQEFDIQVEDTETVPENLDGIERIAEFVHRKTAEASRATA
jgi:acyl carrier protein